LKGYCNLYVFQASTPYDTSTGEPAIPYGNCIYNNLFSAGEKNPQCSLLFLENIIQWIWNTQIHQYFMNLHVSLSC